MTFREFGRRGGILAAFVAAFGVSVAAAQDDPLIVNMARAPATLDPASGCGIIEVGFVQNFYIRLTQYGSRPGPDGTTEIDVSRVDPYLANILGDQRGRPCLHVQAARRRSVRERQTGDVGRCQILVGTGSDHERLRCLRAPGRILRSAADRVSGDAGSAYAHRESQSTGPECVAAARAALVLDCRQGTR